jgi:hypothetical protein
MRARLAARLTWTYVCTIHWRDSTLVTGHVEVDAHRVTSEEMLP